MFFLPRRGRLQRTIEGRACHALPMTETIQSIEVTPRPDGTIAESDEYIQSEKAIKIDRLRLKYGAVEEIQIMWVMVKKKRATEVSGAV